MKSETRENLMELLRVMPIISTRQASRFFQTTVHSTKRASEALRELEKEKLITGKNRLGDSKLWWLTRKGQTEAGILRAYRRPDGLQVPHLLEIGDVYAELLLTGELTHFEAEPKERFEVGGVEYVYRPDAFLTYGGKDYLLEVQRSTKTTSAWGEKHAILELLISSGAWMKAFWHHGKTPRYRIPTVVILSERQQEDTIRGGSNLPFWIIRDLKELIDKS